MITKQTGTNNGDSAPCPRGVYWRQQGKAPCDDLGDIKFRTPNGTEISNTAVIARGYKSGYNAIQTAGTGDSQHNLEMVEMVIVVDLVEQMVVEVVVLMDILMVL